MMLPTLLQYVSDMNFNCATPNMHKIMSLCLISYFVAKTLVLIAMFILKNTISKSFNIFMATRCLGVIGAIISHHLALSTVDFVVVIDSIIENYIGEHNK